jgi:hypothetical protein
MSKQDRSVDELFHGKSEPAFHDPEATRVERLKRYSQGSRLGAKRKRAALTARLRAMADKEAS